MRRIGTYVSVGGLGSAREVHGEHLLAIELEMAPVAPLIGYRQGGDLHNDGTGGSVVQVAPNRIVMNANGADLAVVATETPATAGVTANTWYYAYATATGTTEGLETTNAVPDAALVYRNGVPSRRYLTCYRVDGTGILPFYKTGHVYTYRRSLVAGTRLRAAHIVGAAAWAPVSLAALVPPHARMVHVMIDVYHTGLASAGVRTTGDTAFEAGRAYVANGGGTMLHEQLFLSLECDASNSVDVDLTGGGTVDLFVMGFEERSA